MPADQEHEPSNAQERRSLFNRLTAFETTLIFGGVVLFLFLLYEMQAFLNPPLIGTAAAILLWPLRKHRAVRALLISGAFLIGLWFLDHLSGVLIPFAVVYLLAYLFNPAVSYLKRRFRISRWLSSLMISTLVVGVIALFVLLLVPQILGQIKMLGTRIIEGIGFFRDWLATSTILNQLEVRGLIDKEQLIKQLSGFVQTQATDLTNSLPGVFQNVFASLGSVLGTLTILAIMPVVLFYTLKDYPLIERRLMELFPTRGGQHDYLVKAGGVVGSYLRGLLLISAIAAFNVSVAFILLDVPFGLLLGLLAGFLNLVPNLGALITNFIALLVVFIFGDPWYVDALKVLVVLFAQGLLEQSVLTPNILSYHVGLHPVLIMLALFVFGYFMGIFGFLIAVPATALLMMVYKAYRDEWSMDLSHYTTPSQKHQPSLWNPSARTPHDPERRATQSPVPSSDPQKPPAAKPSSSGSQDP